MMAIDTAKKRRMAACFKPILKAPLPDGTVDTKDRAHISWVYGGVIYATIDETGKVQVILATHDEAETLTLDEVGAVQTILATHDESDVQTMQELGRLQELLAVIGKSETLTLDETAREQVILAILTSADVQAMVESLEQVILAVVGKEEGRLLISRRTTGKFRVLDAIREESVDRVLDSDTV